MPILTRLVRITGIACAFEPHFAHFEKREKPTILLKPAILSKPLELVHAFILLEGNTVQLQCMLDT